MYFAEVLAIMNTMHYPSQTVLTYYPGGGGGQGRKTTAREKYQFLFFGAERLNDMNY